MGTQWGVRKKQQISHHTWAGVSLAASPRSLRSAATAAVHRDGPQELGWRTGDSCLLSKGVQRSELLSSTTHQHNCCLLQITYRILEIRRRRSKGPYVPWLRKSCGELKERGEITFNTVWLKESHYPSTPPCPGAGVSPHSPSLAMATSRRGAPTARGGTGECKGARH